MGISRNGYGDQEILKDADKGFSHSATTSMPGLLNGETEQCVSFQKFRDYKFY